VTCTICTSLLRAFPSPHLEHRFATPYSLTFVPLVRYTASVDTAQPDINAPHTRYVREMRCNCATHAPTDAPDICLMEEEVVLGTILTNPTQPQLRGYHGYCMKLQSEMLDYD
jgi:hypothetical protein